MSTWDQKRPHLSDYCNSYTDGEKMSQKRLIRTILVILCIPFFICSCYGSETRSFSNVIENDNYLDSSTGAATQEIDSLSNNLLSPSQEVYKTIIPTPTFIQIITPNATQQYILFDLLNSKFCNLPCFLNIEPGKTPWPEAKRQLENVGFTFEGKVKSDSYDLNKFSLHFWQEEYDVSLTLSNNIVQRITIKSINNRHPDFYKRWEKYSYNKTITLFGSPDEIYFYRIFPGYRIYTIMVNYKRQKISLIWHSVFKPDSDSMVCPGSTSDEKWNFEFTLTNPSSELGLNQDMDDLDIEEFNKNWHSIKETSGLTVNDYYAKFLTDSSSCINLIWK